MFFFAIQFALTEFTVKKISLVLAALAAFVLFVGRMTRGSDTNEYTWTFETDGKFEGTAINVRYLEANVSVEPEVYLSGTYLGNAAKDGKIKFTIK